VCVRARAGNSWNILKLRTKYRPGVNFQCRYQLRALRSFGVEMHRVGTNKMYFKFEKFKAQRLIMLGD
jgi:hypothetical protein